MNVVAREPSWYLAKRTVEVGNYPPGTDLFTIVRDLVTDMTPEDES